MKTRRTYRHRNLLDGIEDDPMGAVTNLFDVAMVFAVALILAMFTALSVPELLTNADDITIVKNAGKPDMEIIHKEGVQIDRYRMTEEQMGGDGKRLGIAYMLPSGEVVYVPEKKSLPGSTSQ